MPDPQPSASPARAIVGVLVRTLLKIAGTALVTRGLVDQGTVDGLLATTVEEIAGALMVAGASGWSVVRAAFVQSRWAAAWAALQGEAPPPRGTGAPSA